MAKEKRKDEIIYSAIKVFCEKGYNGATVDDIVKKAGCSHGLFYHYFKNKKTIFEEVSQMHGKHVTDYLDKAISEEGNYLFKLKKMTEYAFENIKNDEIFAYRFYFFVTKIFLKAESGELPPKNKIPPHVKMENFFNDGIKNGDFTDKYPASECSKIYYSIINGANLGFMFCPKEFKHNFKFPAVEFIIDIFKKEKN